MIALLLTTALTAAQPAAPASLCGVSFASREGLLLELRAQHAKRSDPAGSTITSVFEPDSMTLWWFTKPGAAAYPAVACFPKRPGAPPAAVEADCRSAEARACDGLKSALAKTRF